MNSKIKLINKKIVGPKVWLLGCESQILHLQLVWHWPNYLTGKKLLPCNLPYKVIVNIK